MLLRAIKPFRATAKQVSVNDVYEETEYRGRDQIAAGLAVEHKMRPAPLNKAIQTTENKAVAGKAPAAGEVPPSSASPADPASPQPTSTTSETGGKRPTLRLKRAKRS